MPKNKGFAVIWDGDDYRQVSHEEAEKLEAEDKCQNLSKRNYAATELKYRREFTGYHTREMRATTAPIPRISKAPAAEPQVEASEWMQYKAAAAKKLDKPWNKVTKAETLAYMEKHFGLAET